MRKKVIKSSLTGLICLLLVLVNYSAAGGSDSVEVGQIDIFVDEEIYSHLGYEIDRLKKDIEIDTGNRVKIIAGDWLWPVNVRNVLVNDFNISALKGAIFIGDIPIAYLVIEYLGRRYSPIPSDYYYQRLRDKDWVEETGNTIVQTSKQEAWSARDIWTSRLWPPGGDVSVNIIDLPSPSCFVSSMYSFTMYSFTDDEKIELLREYFNRNHDYRTGGRKYDGMLYVDSTEIVYENGDVTEKLEEYVFRIAAHTGLYDDSSKVETGYALDHQERKKIILDKLVNNYEILVLHIEGSSRKQLVGGEVLIDKADILNNPPGALFVALESCNNGNIRDAEYLAGYYLFAGDSLLVRANSAAAFFFGGWGPSLWPLNEYRLVAAGVDFGTIYKGSYSGQQSFLFGDPTLTIREKDIENGPRVGQDEITIDLGEILLDSVEPGDVLATVELKNFGKSDLRLTPYDFKCKWLDDETSSNCACLIELPEGPEVDVLSGQIQTISVEMINRPNPGIGRHLVQKVYHTNDPVNPYLTVIIYLKLI